MSDISHAGTTIAITASVTYPTAQPITYLSDDTDPFAVDDLQIADGAMGTNGHVIYWSTHNLASFTLAVIPNSLSDIVLSSIYNANAAGPNKIIAGDVITLARVLPDGRTLSLKNCRMTSGKPFTSMSSSGRLATMTYQFMAPPSMEVY